MTIRFYAEDVKLELKDYNRKDRIFMWNDVIIDLIINLKEPSIKYEVSGGRLKKPYIAISLDEALYIAEVNQVV